MKDIIESMCLGSKFFFPRVEMSHMEPPLSLEKGQ
jgi:hypothetical protein